MDIEGIMNGKCILYQVVYYTGDRSGGYIVCAINGSLYTVNGMRNERPLVFSTFFQPLDFDGRLVLYEVGEAKLETLKVGLLDSKDFYKTREGTYTWDVDEDIWYEASLYYNWGKGLVQ